MYGVWSHKSMMLRILTLIAGWMALARLHLGIANEDGAHDPSAPFVIADPTIAQAIYGRLSPATPVAYYTFTAPEAISVRVMLLIPTRDCQSGFMARFALVWSGSAIRSAVSNNAFHAADDCRAHLSFDPELCAAAAFRRDILDRGALRRGERCVLPVHRHARRRACRCRNARADRTDA
jgi:hypothetical protein